jgi:hypothetical protein
MGFCNLVEFSMKKNVLSKFNIFCTLKSKIYKITSTKSYSLSLLLKECAPIFFPSTFFSFDFI